MADDAVIPNNAGDDWISGFAETQALLNDPAYRVHAEFGGQETADAFVLGQKPERLNANDPSTWGAARAEVATPVGEEIVRSDEMLDDQQREYSFEPGEPEMAIPVEAAEPAPEAQEQPEIALTDILGDETIPVNNEGEAALHALSGAGDAINQVLQISDEVIQVLEGSSVGRWLESVGLGNAYIVWDGEGLRFQQGRPENVPLAQLPTYKMDDPPMVADLSRAVTHFIVAMAALRTGMPGAGAGIGTAQGLGREVISSAGAAATFDPTEGGLVTMLKSMGVESELLAYLDAQVPEGSLAATRLEGRLMLAVEDIILTGGIGALFIAAARTLKSAPKVAAGVAEDLKAAGVKADRLGNTLNNAASYVEGRGAEAMQRLQSGSTMHSAGGTVTDAAIAGAGKVAALRHKRRPSGQYIGGPKGLDNPQKLAALRRKVTGLAREGEEGRFWYERSSEQILDMVGGDVEEADKLIQAIAVTSPGTPVKANFDYALQAYSQWKAGHPIKSGRFPTRMSEKMEDIFAGNAWEGRKTDDFYNNLMIHIDPERTGPVTGDIWMLRAFGFAKANEMPAPQQYKFMTTETQRIAKQLGWEPHQVQAAIWVNMKARSENVDVKRLTDASSEKLGYIKFETGPKGKKRRVMIDEEAHMANWFKHALAYTPGPEDIDKAKFDYADAARSSLAQVSWESIPGRNTRHLPEMFDAPYEQQAEYHVAVSKAFLDQDGTDLIARELGLPTPGDFEAPGYFEGKVSPGTQTEVLAPRQYKGPDSGAVEPATIELIEAYAAARGILMKQDGVGWHRPFYKTTRKKSNGVGVEIGRPLSEAETVQLANFVAKYAGHKEFSPIAFGDGVRFVNFDYVGLDNLEFQGIIAKALNDMQFEGDVSATAKRFHAYTGYAGNDWKVNKNGEGYMDGRWAGRPDLQRKVRGVIEKVAARIDDIDGDFSERYGWTVNQDLNADYRAARGDEELIPPPEPLNNMTTEPAPEAGFLMENSSGN